jgi:hypothetical protein
VEEVESKKGAAGGTREERLREEGGRNAAGRTVPPRSTEVGQGGGSRFFIR